MRRLSSILKLGEDDARDYINFTAPREEKRKKEKERGREAASVAGRVVVVDELMGNRRFNKYRVGFPHP